jgi:hypothetical protein
LWVFNRRRDYRRGRLDAERVGRLEAFSGWAWDAQEAKWEEGFLSLKHYVAREGHARVPIGHVEDGYRLGGWVKTQLRFYRTGRLTEERASQLESLRGWTWDARRRGRPSAKRQSAPAGG